MSNHSTGWVMKVDLFEILDGFFRGVVYFVYSLLASIFVLVRHPVRGPIYLYGVRRASDSRQVSAVTLLFLAYVGANAYLMRGWYKGPLDPTPALDLDAWWPVLTAGLVSTVVIDSTFRLAARRRHRERRRRELALATVEYAMVLPALLVTIVIAHGEKAFYPAPGPLHHVRSPVASFILVWPSLLLTFAVACVLVTPAAMYLWNKGIGEPLDWANVTRSGRTPSLTSTWVTRAGRGASRWIVLAALAILASAAGDGIRWYAYGQRVAAPEVRALDLICHLWANTPYVEVAIVNRSNRPVLLKGDDLLLYWGPFVTGHEVSPEMRSRLSHRVAYLLFFPLQFAQDGRSELIQPGETKLLRGDLIIPPRPVTVEGFQCVLIPSSPLLDLAAKIGVVV
jgi:hypothetical protein